MTKRIHTPESQTQADLTSALLPARRAWIQAADNAMGVREASTSLTIVALMVSRLGPDVQQKTLAREIGVNAAAIVHLLDQGEEAGLLTRTELPEDRRCKGINLLPKGQALAEGMEVRLCDLRRELLADVPAEDIATATRVLRLLEERSLESLKCDKVQ